MRWPGLLGIILYIVSAMPLAAAPVQTIRSAGGLEAWLIEDTTVPAFSLEILIPHAGSAYDPPNKEGLAKLAASLLDEGAGEYDAHDFQEMLDFYAIRLSVHATKDNLSVSLTSLSEHASIAFSLLHDALASPHFAPSDVERLKAEHLAALRHAMSDPTYRASQAMQHTLFPGHPYGRPSAGTETTLASLSASDLEEYRRRHLHRSGIVISVAGDLSAERVQRLMERSLDRLPDGALPTALPEVTPQLGGRQTVRMAVPQTVVTFALPGMAREDERFYAAYILNHLFGGNGLSSRLGQEIREKRGLAYYANSGLTLYDRAALLTGAFATRNDQVEEAIALLKQEIARFGREGPQPEEFTDGLSYLTGSFPARLTANASVVGYVQAMQRYRLGKDYLTKRNDYLEVVSPEEAKKVAKTLFNPEKLLIIAVGQPEPASAPLHQPTEP